MLEPPARDQRAGVDQRLDHRIVGVAFLTLVGEHALASEAGRLLGEAAVGIDGVGNGRIDADSSPSVSFFIQTFIRMFVSSLLFSIQTSKSSRP